MINKAIVIWEKVGSPNLATGVSVLAAIYKAQVSRSQPQVPPGVLEKCIVLENDNTCTRLVPQGKLEQALELYEKALKIDMKVSGKDHPDVACSMNNIALVYKKQVL